MDGYGLIGLLILMGAVFYARLRMDARKDAQTRQRNAAAQAKAPKPVKSSQQNRRQDSYGSLTKRLQAMATGLQSGGGRNVFHDNENVKRPKNISNRAQAVSQASRLTDRYNQVGSAEWEMSAGVNPDRPKTVASAAEQELQSTGKRAGLTFAEETIVLEEETIALQQTYNQLGNVFDEAIDALFSDIPDYGSSQLQPAEAIIQGRKSKPRVTTDRQTIKQGIILANVLERPAIRQAPAAIRRKGV